MSVKDFELFHGAVLTKLFRSDKPVTLRMIETNTSEAWSAYRVNDEATLYIKYSTKPSSRKREENASIWTFNFNPTHLKELVRLGNGKRVYVALVCGQRNMQDSMYICFIEPDKLEQCIDVRASETQTISVKHLPSSKLRVWGRKNTYRAPILVAISELERWTVPGS